MRIVVLNSGKKNGNTKKVIKKLMGQIPINNIEWTIYDLKDYNIKYCKGCQLCLHQDVKTIFH